MLSNHFNLVPILSNPHIWTSFGHGDDAMARRNGSTLDTRTARAKLRLGQRKRQKIATGLYVLYRRGERGGTWGMAVYQPELRDYVVTMFDDVTADDVHDADGITTLNFDQASELARNRHAEQERRATGLPAKSGPYTIEDACLDYLTAYRSGQTKGGAKQVRDTENRIHNIIIPALGKIEIEKLTRDRLMKWQATLAETPPRRRSAKGAPAKFSEASNDRDYVRKRRATANRHFTGLKSILNFAYTMQKVSSDRAWRKLAPFGETHAARLRFLTVSESKRLINACGPGFRELVIGGLVTGCRYSELSRLNVADYHADSGTLLIETSKAGEHRHVHLTDEGVRFFESHAAGRAGDEVMFPHPNGGHRWGRTHQVLPMKTACARAKIRPPITFHGLRHTFASLSVMGGMPLMVVAEALGHADTRMVELHYGHLAPSFIRQSIREHAPKFGIETATNVKRIEAPRRRK
jgi:integrase